MKAFLALIPMITALLAAGSSPAQPAGPTSPPPAMKALTQPQDDYPDISPDGRRIVFQSNRTGTWQLWLMSADGGGLIRLTHNDANDRTPAWSPDGSKIAFSSDRAAGPDQRNIFIMDLSAGVDGADARAARLVGHAGQDIHPKWADGGRRLIFNRVRPANDGADVMIVDADGRNLSRIDLGDGWNTYASMIPDGRRLIYRGTTMETSGERTAENSDIYSAALDGSGRRRLTTEAAFDGWPAASPNGEVIAFASRRAGDRFHIFLAPTDGSAPRQLTFGEYNYTQPAWSPDGRRIAAYRWVQDRTAEIGHIVWLGVESAASTGVGPGPGASM